MRYHTDYQQTHDIDWFFRYQNHLFHVASNGGIIPKKIDAKKNRLAQLLIIGLPDISGSHLLVNNEEGLILTSFLSYAKKGLISIDRFDEDFDKRNYFVVAWPEIFLEPKPNLIEVVPEIDIEEDEINIQGIQPLLR